MFDPKEAERIAHRANNPASKDLGSLGMDDSEEAVEARIDAKLRESAAKGSPSCYLEWEDLGNDPEGMAEKYRQNDWDVEYIDKINSWLFQPKAQVDELDP